MPLSLYFFLSYAHSHIAHTIMKKKRRIPPLPAKPGIAHQHLLDHFAPIPENHDLKIGHVLRLFLKNNKSVAKTIRDVVPLLPASCIITPNDMAPIMRKFTSFKNLGREKQKDNFVTFCSTPFTSFSELPLDSVELAASPDQKMQDEEPTSESGSTNQVQIDKESGLSIFSHHTPSPDGIPGPSGEGGTSSSRSFRSTRGKDTARIKKLKERLEFVSRCRSVEKEKYKKQIKNLKEQINIQRVNEIKYLMQDIKRKKLSVKEKDARIMLLKKEIRELKQELKPVQFEHGLRHGSNQRSQGNLKKLKCTHEHMKESNKQKCKTKTAAIVSKEQYQKLQKELEDKNMLNKQYEREISELKEQLEEITKEKNEKWT